MEFATSVPQQYNSTVSQLFSPSCEQPEQRILAHMTEQPTTGCIAIFHKYCCYTKHGGIITKLNIWNHWGVITDMTKYHNAGIWGMDYNTLRFMFKNI